ncbi:MAG: hypothetical protein E7062_04700 [Spirochaetaceae bacterium]|nr:hypothetical protein [Spirochaetaceae bacterium]
MKKVLLAFFVFLLMSCSNILEIEKRDILEQEGCDEDLSFYAKMNNYVATVEEMEKSLITILNSQLYTENNEIRKPMNFTISCIQKETVTFESNTNLARSITGDIVDSVPLFLYDIMKNGGSSGFAITTTDRRVGLILAIVDNGSLLDNDYGSSFVLTQIIQHIENILEKWNTLQNPVLPLRSAYAAYGEKTDYEFSNFRYNKGNLDNVLTTKWNQASPFNDVINDVKADGKSYCAGCGPIALAQIFTKIRPYDKCSLSNYANIIYEWDKMIKPNGWFTVNPNSRYAFGEFYDETLKKEVATLVYEIGLGTKASFGTESTGVSDSNVKKFLSNKKIPYEYGDYSYKRIVESIDNDRPVYVSGYAKKEIKKTKILGITIWKQISYKEGHAFVVDGYANYTCDVKDVDNNITTITTDFVHVNYGWKSGSCDGFYLSGVFNATNASLSDNMRSIKSDYIPDYYQYYIHGFYNIGLE